MASANIFQQYLKPPKSVADYSADMDKAEASQMELASGRMKLNEARQGEQEKNALRALVSGGGDMTDAASVLRVAPTIGADILKKYGEIGKQRAEIGGITAKTGMDAAHAGKYSADVLDSKLARTRSFAQNIQTPQDAAMYIRGIYSDPELAPIYSKFKTQEQAEAAIPQTAAELAQWKAAHVGMTGEQLMKLLAPKMQVVDAGTTKELIGTNGLTGHVVHGIGASVKVGVTPSAQLSSDTARRGQDITAQTSSDNNFQRSLERGDARGEAKTKQLDSQVTHFADSLQKTGIPSFNETLESIKGDIAKFKNGDIPGVGMTGNLPQFLLSREGQQLRQKLMALQNIELKERSGAAVTDGEMRRYLAELGGTFRSDQQVMDAITNVDKRFQAIKQNAVAGANDDVLNEYTKRGGIPVSRKAADKKVTVGGQSLDAKLAPDGKYYVQRNGAYFEVKE